MTHRQVSVYPIGTVGYHKVNPDKTIRIVGYDIVETAGRIDVHYNTVEIGTDSPQYTCSVHDEMFKPVHPTETGLLTLLFP